MSMSTQQFINTYNNKYVLWKECVALFFQYNQDVVAGEAYGAPGACNLWTTTGGQPYIWNSYDRIPNNQDMKYGDVVIWSGSYGSYPNGGYGHVAIYVSDNGGGRGNFFSQNPNPAQILNLSYNGIIGYLRPKKFSSTVKPAASTVVPIKANQRKVGPVNVNQRAEPNTKSKVVRNIAANTTETFTGYVVGERVNGWNLWYKDAQGYAWCGGFTTQVTTGLPDQTPKPVVAAPPALKANQRKVGGGNVNQRAAANTSSAVVRVIAANSTETFTGYVIGQKITLSGVTTDVWYKDAKGYAWSGGFNSQSTTGLSNLTPKPPVVAKPPVVVAPTPPTDYSFTKDFDFVEYLPADKDNVQRATDNPGKTVFPAKPQKVVIHQFGTLGVDTVGSTINTFKSPTSQVSAHFVVSGKRIIQMVSLKDRAYHAYVVGNDYVGIETDPAQDADTIASTKRLLSALKAKYGYKLETVLHKNVPQCSTNCGAAITLAKYEIDVPVTKPPVVVPPVTAPPAQNTEREVLIKFATSLVDSYLAKK